jgi:hypothetical protein
MMVSDGSSRPPTTVWVGRNHSAKRVVDGGTHSETSLIIALRYGKLFSKPAKAGRLKSFPSSGDRSV